MKSNQTMKLDWFEAVHVAIDEPVLARHGSAGKHKFLQEIMEFYGFNPDTFSDVEKCQIQEYSGRLTNGSITILIEYGDVDTEDYVYKVKVTMSGHGVDSYAEYMMLENGNFDWVPFFERIISADSFITSFKRIDSAVDTFNMRIPKPKVLRKYCLDGRFKSSARKAIYYESIDLVNREVAGTTLYIGSPSSPQRLRIYDKLEEQKNQGNYVSEDINKWIRLELQLRREKADEFVEECVNKGTIQLATRSVFVGHYSFHTKKVAEEMKTSHKARDEFPITRWWEEIVGDIEGSRLQLHTHKVSLDDTEKWLKNSASPSQYKIYLAKRMLAKLEDDFAEVYKIDEIIEKFDVLHNGVQKAYDGIPNDYGRKFVEDVRSYIVEYDDAKILHNVPYNKIIDWIIDEIGMDMERIENTN